MWFTADSRWFMGVLGKTTEQYPIGTSGTLPPWRPPHGNLRGGILRIARRLAPCGPWAEKLLSLCIADLLHRLLQQKPSQLHRLDRDLTVFSNLGRQLLQAREGLRCQRDQTTL